MICLATNYQTDSANSRSRFAQFVKPALEKFGFRDVVSTEKQDSELKRFLDYSCIDALGKQDGMTVTFASRVIQKIKTGSDYDCFSLRSSRRSGHITELEKLRQAIEKDSLRPQWHCQSFISEDGKTATCGLIRTSDLLWFIDTCADETKTKPTNSGDSFVIADWKNLTRAGVDVRTKKISL